MKLKINEAKTIVLTSSNMSITSTGIRRPIGVLCSYGESHTNRDEIAAHLESAGVGFDFYYVTSTVGSRLSNCEKATRSYSQLSADEVLTGKALLNRHPYDLAKSYIDILIKSKDKPVLIVEDRFRFLDTNNTSIYVPSDADAVAIDIDYDVSQLLFTSDVQGKPVVPSSILQRVPGKNCHRVISCGNSINAMLYISDDIKAAAIEAFSKAMEPIKQDGVERFVSPGHVVSKLILPNFKVYSPGVPLGVTAPYGQTKGVDHAKKYSQLYWAEKICSRHPELVDIATRRASLNKPVI